MPPLAKVVTDELYMGELRMGVGVVGVTGDPAPRYMVDGRTDVDEGVVGVTGDPTPRYMVDGRTDADVGVVGVSGEVGESAW